MGLEIINNGDFDYDGSAEKIRTSFEKAKNMFAEIYEKYPFDFPAQTAGFILKVKVDRSGFELVALDGGGDMLSSNNLSDLEDAEQGRLNLGLGSAAQSDDSDFATSAQGAKADSAIQTVTVSGGLTIDVTDPQNIILGSSEENDYVDSISFAPLTGILTLGLLGGGSVTYDMSRFTVLEIDGFQVKKGVGTNPDSIEIGDKCSGWDGDKFVAFRVDALPYTTEANRSYAVNGTIF